MICSASRFDIWGMKDQVIEAQKFTVERLRKYNKAATCNEYRSWKYEDPPKSDNWKQFSLLDNHELELAYKVIVFSCFRHCFFLVN